MVEEARNELLASLEIQNPTPIPTSSYNIFQRAIDLAELHRSQEGIVEHCLSDDQVIDLNGIEDALVDVNLCSDKVSFRNSDVNNVLYSMPELSPYFEDPINPPAQMPVLEPVIVNEPNYKLLLEDLALSSGSSDSEPRAQKNIKIEKPILNLSLKKCLMNDLEVSSDSEKQTENKLKNVVKPHLDLAKKKLLFNLDLSETDTDDDIFIEIKKKTNRLSCQEKYKNGQEKKLAPNLRKVKNLLWAKYFLFLTYSSRMKHFSKRKPPIKKRQLVTKNRENVEDILKIIFFRVPISTIKKRKFHRQIEKKNPG